MDDGFLEVIPVGISEEQMLLKDHLLVDLSSCSSSGFKSLPTHPSFSSSSLSAQVRLFIDADVRPAVPPTKNGLGSSSSTALFCSVAVNLVNAVKSSLCTVCFLPCGEESIKWGRDVAASILNYGGDSSDGNWDYGEFTVETSGFRGWNGFVSEGKDAVVMGREIVDGTDGEDRIHGRSTGPCFKEWLKDKEQFSPFSVLDCPFEDDEEMVDTQSESFPANIGARKGNHRRTGVSQLEECIASLELEEETTTLLDESTLRPSKTSCLIEEDHMEAILERILETVRAATVLSYNFKSDILLRDFFMEKLTEWEEYRYAGVFHRRDTFEDKAVHADEDWAHGESRDSYVGWEIERTRTAFIKDMERGGGGVSERYEVCLKVDNLVWTLLVYETLIDIF